MLWEVYSYEFAGAVSVPAAAADLLMLSMLSDIKASYHPLAAYHKARPGTTTAVYQFNAADGLFFFKYLYSSLFSITVAVRNTQQRIMISAENWKHVN